jgi:hypothetical protein
MTLRRFIDVGFAVLVGEYQRLGVDLISAIEKVSALGSEGAESSAVSATDNAASMQLMMSQLAGVKGAPV